MGNEGIYITYKATNSAGESLIIMGQIYKEYEDSVYLFVFENFTGTAAMAKNTTVPKNLISRATINVGTKCLFKGSVPVEIVACSRKRVKDTPLKCYYCRFLNRDKKNDPPRLVSEKDLIAPYDAYFMSPLNTAKEETLGDYSQFLTRHVVKDYIENYELASDGVGDAIGNRIELYAHQIDTVRTVLRTYPYRAFLSDEVGLGKSIEALTVLSHAINTGRTEKAMIIVPDQLVFQWRNEAENKFSLDAKVFYFSSFVKGLKSESVLIIGFGDYERYYEDYFAGKAYDFVIVDEAHRVLRKTKLYKKIVSLSEKAENFIMLSATPILEREQEYFRLLSLLNPQYYKAMGIERFQQIMVYRSKIKDDVIYCRNHLGKLRKYNSTDKFVQRFENINSVINDGFVTSILEKLSDDTESNFIQISSLIRYLCIRYEIEQKFIRHRRSDLPDFSFERVNYLNESFGYSDYANGLSEVSTLSDFWEILESKRKEEDKNFSIEKAMELGKASYSSFVALENTILSLNLEDSFSPVLNQIRKCKRIEAESMDSSRLRTLDKVLSGLPKEAKVIIFTDYSATANLLSKFLGEKYGASRSVKFLQGMSPAEMQIAARLFQRNSECKYMVCDKSGGEGRNFQFVDFLIHYDLPWYPDEIEQRIGRLDRIGREKGHNVNNIIIHSEESIEEDIYHLFDSCFGVFNRSLSGLEVAFEDMNEAIKTHCSSDLRNGFSTSFDELCGMKDVIQDQLAMEELESSVSDFMSDKDKKQLEDFAESNNMEFAEALRHWLSANQYGDFAVQDGITTVSFDKKYVTRIRKKSGLTSVLERYDGTFSIKQALSDEDVPLFSLRHPIIRFLAKDIVQDNTSKICGVSQRNSKMKWRGFIFEIAADFSFPDFCKNEWTPILDNYKNEYLLRKSLAIAVPVDGFVEQDAGLILGELLKDTDGCSSINYLEMIEQLDFPSDFWGLLKRKYLMAKEVFTSLFGSYIKYDALCRDIEAIESQNLLNHRINMPNPYDDTKEIILRGFKAASEKCSASLDSILYVDLG